jgi:DNA-binding XRE family transcriptional regulator
MSPAGDEMERDMAQHWSAIFGAEVRLRRVQLGLETQQALVERMGYKTHATITQIEMGNIMANFEVAMELARFLGIDLNAVMGVVAPPPPPKEWYSDMFMLRLPAKVHELWSHAAQQEILTRTVEEMGRAMRETRTQRSADHP